VKVTNNAFGTYGQGAIIPFRYLNYDHFGYVTFLENKIGLLFEIGYVYDCYGVVYYDVPIGYTQHELMITADGDNYQVFIDDMNAPVITETFSPAGFGDGTGVTGERLGVWTYEHGSASFDDFSVSVKSVDHWNVDIKPEILNINSAGNWITAYIEVPDEYDVNTIDVSTVRMSGIIPAETSMFGVGDYDRDKIPDMMVKFSRAKVCEQLVSGLNTLTITGCLHDGTLFSGDDIVVGIDQNARIALRS